MQAVGRETDLKHFLSRGAFVKGASHNNIRLSVNLIFIATKMIMAFLLEIHSTIPQEVNDPYFTAKSD
jgi:hypothetical protein